MNFGNRIWYSFSPRGSGGSFGREDMGVICKVGTITFVIPMFEQSADKISRKHIEAKIEEVLPSAKKDEIFELIEGNFRTETSINWDAKLKESLISLDS